MQIVQELCRRPSLNQTCFDMPTIYINNDGKPKRCVNQIQHVCEEISKTINMTLQKTLNQLEVDWWVQFLFSQKNLFFGRIVKDLFRFACLLV